MVLTWLKLYLLTLMIIHFHCPITANGPQTLAHRTAIFTDGTFPLKELRVLCKHAERGPTLNKDPNRLVCLTSFKIRACKQPCSNRSFKSPMPQGWQLLEMKNGAPSLQILKFSIATEEKAAIRSSQRPSSTDSMEKSSSTDSMEKSFGLTATSGEREPSCHL